MNSPSTGNRAFPSFINHPSQARRFKPTEFVGIEKKKIQEAGSSCVGHTGTVIWYAKQLNYIVEIQFTSHPPVYIQSTCTFTPTFGMDRIDGEFAQDAEEYVLHEVLGYQSQRLAALPSTANIPIEQYLMAKGLIKKKSKPWWKFW